MTLFHKMLPLVLRASQMGVMLLIVQLTFMYCSSEIFIFFNHLIFFTALHTCLTYSAQVNIWNRTDNSNKQLLILGVASACLVLLLYSLFYNVNLYVILALFLYLIAKFADRIFFNKSISGNCYIYGYLGIVFVLLIELLATSSFILFDFNFDYLQRFIIPSLFMLLFSCIFIYVLEKYYNQVRAIGVEKTIVAMAMFHAFCILIVAMSDRILIQYIDVKHEVKALYLLFFSYAGAFYTLMASFVEVKRSNYFEIANKTNSISTFLKEINFKRQLLLVFTAFLFLVVLSGLFFRYFASAAYAGGLHLWIGTLSYFCLLLMLVYLHTFFLAKHKYKWLFLIWGGMFIVKIVGFLSFDLNFMIIFNILSCLVGVVLSLYLGGLSDDS